MPGHLELIAAADYWARKAEESVRERAWPAAEAQAHVPVAFSALAAQSPYPFTDYTPGRPLYSRTTHPTPTDSVSS